jgi:hypothetical protein
MKIVFSKLLSGESSKSVKGMQRFMAALGLAVAMIAAGYFLWICLQAANANSLARIDRALPSLKVDSLGGAVDLRAVAAGAQRVIVFYSPSCPTCKEVLPGLLPFPPDLRLIMVNESSESNGPEISSLPATALLRDRWHALSHAFTVASLPTLLFVDGNGILRDGLIGRHERLFIQKKLKEFAKPTGSRTSLKP